MNEFEKLVQSMRDAQKEYFKTRNQTALNTSKMLERQVDAHLRNKQNPDLFS